MPETAYQETDGKDIVAKKGANIIMIAAVDMPEGSGEGTRLKTLVYALKEGGNNVHILLENTSGNVDEKLLQAKGEIDGIPFEYILGNTHPLKGANFFLAKAKAIRLFLNRLEELNRIQKIDVIWFNMLAAHTIWPLTNWAKKHDALVVHSYEDERMKGGNLKRQLIYFNQLIADKYLTLQADAIVTISYYLKHKYEKLVKNKVPVVIIPTIVDAERWQAGVLSFNTIPVLLYYGAFYGFDEIELMIDAVGILKKKGKPVKLWIGGYNSKKVSYMDSLQNYIDTLGLSDLVEMKGFMPHDNLMGFIKQSDILIGLRKNDPWSSTGLSTKLSEYLSTGRPVIATAIGDNNKYLTHRENAILLAPGCTAKMLADAIENLTADREMQTKLGNAGRQMALDTFDKIVVSKKLNEMLDEMAQKQAHY